MKNIIYLLGLLFICVSSTYALDYDYEIAIDYGAVTNASGRQLNLAANGNIIVSGIGWGPEFGYFSGSVFTFFKNGDVIWRELILKDKPIFHEDTYVNGSDVNFVGLYARGWYDYYYSNLRFFSLNLDSNGELKREIIDTLSDQTISKSVEIEAIKVEDKFYIFDDKLDENLEDRLVIFAKIYDNEGNFIYEKNIDTVKKSEFQSNIFDESLYIPDDGIYILITSKIYLQYGLPGVLVYKLSEDGDFIWKKALHKDYSLENSAAAIVDGKPMIMTYCYDEKLGTKRYEFYDVSQDGEITGPLLTTSRDSVIYAKFKQIDDEIVAVGKVKEGDSVNAFYIEFFDKNFNSKVRYSLRRGEKVKILNDIMKTEDGFYVTGSLDSKLYFARLNDVSAVEEEPSEIKIVSYLEPYPNPSQTKVFFNREDDSPITSIDVFSSVGRKLFCEYEVLTDEMSVDIRNLPPGAYFIRFDSPKGVRFSQIIKK